jgi:hypothetical protein
MYQVRFQCKVSNSNPSAALSLSIWLDDKEIYKNSWVKHQELVEYSFDDNDGEHQLKWVLSGKTDQHTQIDDQGNIIKDALITVTDVAFDDIELGHCFNELAAYQHDFNGHGQSITESFNNHLGCNGTVTLNFTTPIYLWLLENM